MFATAHHSTNVLHRGSGHLRKLKSASAIRADRQWRRERWMAVGVLVLFGALIAILMAIAIYSGSSLDSSNTGAEFWMMP
jgi:hypothetical protein